MAQVEFFAGGGPPHFRIAFAIQRYFEFGGQQRDMLRMAQACARLGHEIHVLTSRWDGPKPDGLTVNLLDAGGVTNHGRATRFGESVRDFAGAQEFDCLVGFSRIPHLDVFWCGDTCQRALHEREKPRFARWLPRYRTYLRLENSIMRRGAGTELLVLCPQEMQRVVHHYGTEESRLHLLPGGVDRHRFETDEEPAEIRRRLRRELGIPADEFMALCVGSSFKTKGIDRAIRSLASLPQTARNSASLVIVGQGTAAPFTRLAGKLGVADRVRFTGGRTDVVNFYRAADVLIHCARVENTGLTILEAIVCRLPVLVTENCGYAYHVAAANAGLTCPIPFSQGRLDQNLFQSLDANRCRQWRQSAAKYSAETDLYGMVEKTVDLIIDKAAERRRARQANQSRHAA